MQYLALDIGEKRVGIAVGNTHTRIAHPLKVLPFAEVISHASSFRMILQDHEPDALVCGLPATLAGEKGAQAQWAESQAQQIAQQCKLDVYFVDERLSSREAKRILHEQGLNEKQMRGKIDMLAASLFLQSFLDQQEEK